MNPSTNNTRHGGERIGVSVPRRYLSERELHSYSGIAVRTFQNWRLRNMGPPFHKLCGSIKYDVQEFDAWVKAQ
jgi:hypothetical protein